MATVKCQNPHCDYFQKPVPQGEFCPFCGEPLGIPQPEPDLRSQPNLEPTPQSFSFFNPPTPDRSVPSPPTFVSPPTMVESKFSDRSSITLVHDCGKKFSIPERTPHKRFYIGRKGGPKMPKPEIDLTDIPHSERISRPHAHIVWDDRVNSYMFVDENSTNGSILNGQSLEPFQPYRLNNGDILELGREQKVIFTIEII
ncbi:MAG: FHA domain-containing protein [Prochloraceae cyanobacterium]|nr:FHA domain-containing protein [Prochloraceae cyanobacterium]